jgi:ferredoxin
MTEPLHFHSDLYRRDAIALAARKFSERAGFELVEAGPHVVVTARPTSPAPESTFRSTCGEFCNEALSATAVELRSAGSAGSSRSDESSGPLDPPWQLLSPFTENTPLALGWVLGSLGAIRSGGSSLGLRHEEHGTARVIIRRNAGTPRGVAHTRDLDFMVFNGGDGTVRTESSLGRVLLAFAAALEKRHDRASDGPFLAALLPHGESPARGSAGGSTGQTSRSESPRRIVPELDLEDCAVTFDFDDSGVDRLALYDAVLSFTDRSYVFLAKTTAGKIRVEFKPRTAASPEAIKLLARDTTKVLNRALRPAGDGDSHDGRRAPRPAPRPLQLDALLGELEAADPATIGLGFEPERGPEHENLRVLNVRGTGACNSDCVFCVEKFNPSHRSAPNADATRQLILGAAGQFDMLFFASGEPTIHPKLFEHTDLAKTVGFTCFGMSSHFRTFADPHFARRVLEAGFRYFDISLHAADAASQLEVNPIGDDGRSLDEALKGLAVLFRLAEALDTPISVTQKIVVSRLNVQDLEPIFRATYDRGVRHFILQPVKAMGLAPDLQTKLSISEEEVMPHLNELLRKTEGLGAVIKPYGFSRQGLLTVSHLETEQNRVKNIYGKAGLTRRAAIPVEEQRPTDGRHWVEVRMWLDTQAGADQKRRRWGFATDGKAPVLDEALQRGMDASYGCRMGSCGMCCARLVSGTVDQSDQIFLSEEQVQEGYVLLCQAHPQSDVVLEVCTDQEIDAL